jgi:phosphoribosylanthranilate isomerase
MKLKFVTLTGADNSVRPADLRMTSERYPFVEWAILFSKSKSGVPRYPSYDWVLDFAREVFDFDFMNSAAHLCGKWVEDAMQGKITFLHDIHMDQAFSRIQLNMGKDRLREALRSSELTAATSKILQRVILGGNYASITADPSYYRKHGLAPLFDASGGRGVLTREWPKPLADADGPLFCGYAGGLGPDNVAEELARIAEVVGDVQVWIDMETGIRSKNDKFDLQKCDQVLEAALPWVG